VPQRAAPMHAGTTPAMSAYEWNAGDAISRWQRGTLWSLLAAKHVDDLLAGFDDAQIARYSSAAGSATFNAFVADAARHGVGVELLLGDPSWIAPSGIPSLEAILHRLRAVRFAGLNLDLEPNEVRGRPIRAVLEDLARSMRAYVAYSPWPVTLDINDFYAGGKAAGGYCVMCELRDGGLRRVDLMTYVADPPAVERIDRPIVSAYPSIRFQTAQSVEPPSVIPARDSYWSWGYARFYRAMRRLSVLTGAQPNAGGIVVESLQYLESMKP